MTESMKDWALQYARMGFAVFPIKPRDKTPLTRHGFKDATTDNTVISSWWDKYPNANIAVATGSRSGGLVVIDLDVKHPPINGISNCDEWQMRNGFFPRTLICETGSGGRHLYFKTTANFKSKNGILPGIDIKSEGGYVVVPPSSNDKGQYRYINNLPIADANEKVLIFLTGKESYGKPMKETPEGNRDNTMLAQTYKLARDFDNREEALEIALVMNQKCIPPLEEKIIESMLDRAYKKIREESRAKVVNFDEIKPEEVEWLWYPYIPYGKLTIIHGDGGEGKTTLILRLAALLSRGEKLPCDDTEREPIKVIYQTAEDGLGDTIKPRLLAGNADCSQIKVIDESEAALTMLDERVEKAIAETGARVMILDPMQAYIGAKVDMNRANEVRAILSQLGRIADKYRCAIILVGHLNKAQGNKSNYRGLGSIDFQAAARSVLVVGRVKDKPEIRVVAHQKSSLAPEGKPIAFELSEANGFKWLGHYEISIDDLLSGISREKKSDMAESLIVDCLSGGKYPQQTLLQKAQSLGISKRVLDEAKKTLRVRSVKEGSVWYWQLPEEKESGDL